MKKQFLFLLLLGLLCAVGNVWGENVTFNTKTGSTPTWSGTTSTSMTGTIEGYTVAFNKGSAGSAIGTGSSYFTTQQGMTISVSSTTNFSQIVFNFSGEGYAPDKKSDWAKRFKASAGTLTKNTNTQYTWSGDASSITFSHTNDDSGTAISFRFTSIVITPASGGGNPVAPSITGQPSNQEVEQGDAATFTVVVTGSPAPTYQWYSCEDSEKTGASPINGATSASYSPSTASIGTFYYYVVVTNSEGSVTSNVVSLSVSESTAYYAPSSSEIIILNNVYNSSKTTSGYSNHKAVAWGGTASSNSKTAGDPNNGGAATSSNVACYNIKNNGNGRNISLSITGVSKVTLYHENKTDRYPQLILTPNSGEGETLSGSKSVYYNEFYIDATKSYSIALQGYDGSDKQDFYVYAIKLDVPYELSITSAGWASMYLDFPAKVPTGVTTYYASAVTNSAVTLSPISAGQVIPANTGVVVSGTAGNYDFAHSAEEPESVGTNYFKGCLVATAVEASTKYVLSPESTPESCVFGLYAGTTLGAYKAYMNAADRPEAALAPDRIQFIIEGENNATNIENIESTDKAVKFIENGRILILRDGITYDALGRIVK